MRVVGGQNALRHPCKQHRRALRLLSRSLKGASPEQAQATKLGDGKEDVRRGGQRKTDAAGRRGKRHARLRQRAPIADAGAKREGQFLGGGAARGVPGVAAREERYEGREMLAYMERGVHVIGEERGLLRRAFAAERERRQQIDGRPMVPARPSPPARGQRPRAPIPARGRARPRRGAF